MVRGAPVQGIRAPDDATGPIPARPSRARGQSRYQASYRLATPDLRIHAREQLVRDKGFGDKVVRSSSKPRPFGRRVGLAAEKQHWHRVEARVGAELAADFQAVLVLECNVEQDHVWQVRLCECIEIGCISRRSHFDIAVLQRKLQCPRHARFVVDEQDARHTRIIAAVDPVLNTTDLSAARRLAFLERVVRATAEQTDHAQLLRRIIDEATEATGTQVCSLYLWDDAEKQLVLTATNGLAQSGVGAVHLGLGEGVTGWVAAHRRPLAVADVRVEPRFVWVPNLDQERFLSMLSVPIESQARVIGVMNLQTVDVHEFSAHEVAFVQALAAQVAGIIELSSLRSRLAGQLALEREAVQRLTALNASKSDLLGMLSHDFRGPLSIARSYVYGLLNRVSGQDQEACRELELELDSLERMTDNLMLSLELESQHQLVLELEEFDLFELVELTCRGLRRTSSEHVLLFERGAGSTRLTADRSKVRSVVINLVGNAVKYSPHGGRIWVRVTAIDEGVELTVQDEGIGLGEHAEREADTIFQRYGRGDTALQHGIRGHGLGLFICRRIAETHGGHLFARPLVTGTCFTLVLPRVPS